MNRPIQTKRVKGKGLIYTNPCPNSTVETTYFVGNPRTCNSSCPYYKREFINKEGVRVVHCDHP